MRLPTLAGVIDRRLLINFRVRPEWIEPVLPEPFRPQVVDGWALAGICLIRLRNLRPRGWPRWCGVRSENAAHRVAVEWERDGLIDRGVYIPRRDTSSRLTAACGRFLSAGRHGVARFEVVERGPAVRVGLQSRDCAVRLEVHGDESAEFPADSIFPSLDAASRFFERGAVGYSDGEQAAARDGIELRIDGWEARPFAVRRAVSNWFGDGGRFPAEFDHALIMRGIPHEWHSCPPLVGPSAGRQETAKNACGGC